MKRLLKTRASARGIGISVPSDPSLYIPLGATYVPELEEFYGSALDTDDWSTSDSSYGTGGSTTVVASSCFTIQTGTGTAGTATVIMRSALSAAAHLYSLPVRVKWFMRMFATAGAGVSPTGGLDIYMGLRTTDNTHIAQFHLDGSTAGGSSLASPVVETQVYGSTTGAAFLSSSAFNPFSTAVNRTFTATNIVGYVIEATPKGVWFSLQEDVTSIEAPRLLSHVGSPLIRQDLQYGLDFRAVISGTNGYTSTGAINIDLDQIVIEQITPQADALDSYAPHNRLGSVRTYTNTATFSVSAAGALVTSGMGVFYTFSVTSTSTTAVNSYIAVFDASAAGSAIYNYSFTGGANTLSAASRLMWIQQVNAGGSVPSATVPPVGLGIPAFGIPFYRGLVVGETTANGGAVGNSAFQAVVVYRAQ